MLIMLVIMTHIDQQLVMCSVLNLEPLLGVKRQPKVSLSTTEAEYRAATMAAQKSTWLVQLMKDMHQPVDYAVPLYCDNQSVVQLVENPVFFFFFSCKNKLMWKCNVLSFGRRH